MLDAILEGTPDPDVLADLAVGRLRNKRPHLQEALLGRVQPHHQILLRHLLAHIDFLDLQLEP